MGGCIVFVSKGLTQKFLGDGIFNADREIWSECRALLRPQFLKQRVSDLQTFETHISELITLIPKDGETFDIMDLWYRFTLDTSCEYLFGQSVGSLANPKVLFHSLSSEYIGLLFRSICQASRESNGQIPSWTIVVDVL